MKSDLRQNPQRSMGRYWLTMSDASAFTLVNSSFYIAEALRRDLAEKTQILAKESAAEMAVSLLTAVEAGWGKGKASQLVSKIVELKKHSPARKSTAYSLIRDAMENLPLTLWPPDKLPARRELLEELGRLASNAQAEMPLLPSYEEQREQQWRDSIAALSRAESRQRL
ncbi:hypothetical protein [Collimonas sp.]|jgi:hypothetical protein|uniref:hypothetical protein n=1 Tax=Collimonas sp. TaxID=1963772 RepID=UPI002CD65E55|nr:hypothetical protein [Collimonas sp.]HWW05963.1 hypothetical protein [Collimonas sp.]